MGGSSCCRIRDTSSRRGRRRPGPGVRIRRRSTQTCSPLNRMRDPRHPAQYDANATFSFQPRSLRRRRWDRAGAAAGAATIAPPRSRGGWRCSRSPPGSWPSIDVAKLRASPAAAKLVEQAKQDPADQHEIDEFAKRTGFDPLRQLNSVTVAFPEEARAHGELGAGPARRSPRRGAAGGLRARPAAEERRRSDGHAARPVHALVVQARSGRGRVLPGRRRPSCWARAAGGRRWPTWPRARAPSTARPPTWIWSTWSSGPPRAHDVWAAAIVPEATRKSLASDPKFCRCGRHPDAVGGARISARGWRPSCTPISRRPREAERWPIA